MPAPLAIDLQSAASAATRSLQFILHQPLGAAGLLVIVIMALRGDLRAVGRAVRSADRRLRRHARGAVVAALDGHRFVRPRRVVAHHLRRAHRARGRLSRVVHRLHARRDRSAWSRPISAARSTDHPGRDGHAAVVSHHRARAHRGGDARPEHRLRRRRQSDHRHRHPDGAARRARGALVRAGDPRAAVHRRRARGRLFATRASSSATWCRTWSRPT